MHFLVAEVHGDAEVVVPFGQGLRSENHRKSEEHSYQCARRERD